MSAPADDRYVTVCKIVHVLTEDFGMTDGFV